MFIKRRWQWLQWLSEVEVDSECRFERGKFGGNPTNRDRSLHG